MRFEELAETLLHNHNQPLARSQWPQEILLPTKSNPSLFGGGTSIFWEKVSQLRKYTDVSADKFPKEHSGSTGWEYEFVVACVDDSIYFSDPYTSRNYEQVSSGHSLQIDMSFDQVKQIVTDKVLLDQKQVGVNVYMGRENIDKRNDKIKRGVMPVGFVCHIHSHPQIMSPNLDKAIYTFFSPQDIESLLTKELNCLGLVSDRLWLACRTKDSTMPTHRDLHSVTTAEALTPGDLVNIASDIMSRYEIVLYVSPFGGKLERVN